MSDDQGDLFSKKRRRDHDRASYRKKNPETSKQAAERSRSFRGRHHAEILRVMRAAGGSLAAEQISDLSGMLDYQQVLKRLVELHADGIIERTDETHKNRSGSNAKRYRLVMRQEQAA